MTIRNLEFFFHPKNLVLIGASQKPGSVGFTIAKNLLRSGFSGDIAFVNPHYSAIDGTPCYATVDRLPFTPELAVIATPPRTVPQLVSDLGAMGCRAAVIITAGVRGEFAQAMLNGAKPHLMRLIGPNCIGVQVPGLNLDASFAQTLAKPGDIALVLQSGALTTAMLEWAKTENIGFSHVVSIGDAADVDLGDMLDYLAGDVTSRAVFLYIESVTHAAKFISAARRCSRAKPVIAIKAGRHPEAAKAAASHTGALAGSDFVYDAALRRAGILRVLDLDEMFDAAEVLSHLKSVPGSRLTIVTNGGGAGVIAADALADLKGVLATLEPKTIERLNASLPETWSHGNPIDIVGDGGADRYRAAMAAALDDGNTDAVLAINCPTALASSTEAAEAVAAAAQDRRKSVQHPKPVIANWLGQSSASEVQSIFGGASIPHFQTPSAAVKGLMQVVDYGAAQAQLMRTPPALPGNLNFNSAAVAAHISQTLKDGRRMMTEPEAKAVLAAYGIPTVPTYVAPTPEKAREAAAGLLRDNASVVVKILSPRLTHKSDIGGVRLDIRSAEEAENTARHMLHSIGALRPDAFLQGVTVQPMIQRADAYELILGVTSDPTFGPVILFGAGGTGVEAIGDTAMALAPLDLQLASDLISSTRIYRLLKGFRDRRAVDLNGLALCLVKLSSLALQHREIRELDINPLLIDEKGIIALDARITVADLQAQPATPPAIRPYPDQWQSRQTWLNREEILIRPIRPDDERLYALFMAKMTPEDIRLRMFSPVREFSHQFLARMTQIDYAREMAFVALREIPGGTPEMLGVARFFADPDYKRAEYAVMVRSDLKGHGLGWMLMRHLITYARAEGLAFLHGCVLRDNAVMLEMCRELGFNLAVDEKDPTLYAVVLDLKSDAAAKTDRCRHADPVPQGLESQRQKLARWLWG
ncbi:MAG: bifunctional acetate--CoA ligase family protein/GNAT family N-acetyltransferase [Rhodomicrobium sp.]